ncbi:MAG: MATE efflux family protein [candidate division TM6 bacterium GW2011_GWF2_32_72]|nr:MAG: MATE efflux family protein [candidate division TM6 bacterium GW2011_GWF2_32_72]
MKQRLLKSYFSGIIDTSHGESYKNIFRYFFPELITALFLYSALQLLDLYFIGQIKSTAAFATNGVTNTFVQFIVKIAEGLSVGTLVLVGRFNGAKQDQKVGDMLVASFWTSVFVGGIFFAAIYFGAYHFFYLYRVPENMISLGIPFLKLKAVALFISFVYFGFLGFLRGVKNTRVPMYTFIIGGIAFIIADYLLIFGKLGFPELGFFGAAIAQIVQYSVGLVVALIYVFGDKNNRKYGIELFSVFKNLTLVKELIFISIPVILDKATVAGSYVWLARMLAPLGAVPLASFSAVKDLERFALLPAVALANVITLVVSNDLGAHDWSGIKTNVKKIVFLSSVMVLSILLAICLFAGPIFSLFDPRGEFAWHATYVFPPLAILVYFDLLQLILSAALRGAANVKLVMWVRFFVCMFFFVPVSYLFTKLDIPNPLIRFILIYGSFYIANAIASAIYIKRFRDGRWKVKQLEDL